VKARGVRCRRLIDEELFSKSHVQAYAGPGQLTCSCWSPLVRHRLRLLHCSQWCHHRRSVTHKVDWPFLTDIEACGSVMLFCVLPVTGCHGCKGIGQRVWPLACYMGCVVVCLASRTHFEKGTAECVDC
jgi:hypothetical protein